ncbi:HEAT repeat domain-containing protein [Pantoea ananatis]|uniref:HEAT repeat domain-containing protein n=1 Tax=Pantoea ananas TaxID=553 RepID=UPI001F4DCC36|nr:HEAT repeat domain-containing protein [Pantoea ananatis]MCH9271092.1 HEAT repeat domain-containing protein [Pantoea ananatis]
MSMPQAMANLLLKHVNGHNRELKLAAIYALGEGRCTALPIIEYLMDYMDGDDIELKIAAIRAYGRIYR